MTKAIISECSHFYITNPTEATLNFVGISHYMLLKNYRFGRCFCFSCHVTSLEFTLGLFCQTPLWVSRASGKGISCPTPCDGGFSWRRRGAPLADGGNNSENNARALMDCSAGNVGKSSNFFKRKDIFQMIQMVNIVHHHYYARD